MKKEFCQRGHALSESNRDSSGRCRTCSLGRSKRYYQENTEVYRATNDRWKKDNPEKHKNAVLKSVHGVTLEWFNDRLKVQENRCAICGLEFSEDRKPYIDHNHRTKTARELLCQHCNSLIGFCKENVRVLYSAIAYLVKHHQ